MHDELVIIVLAASRSPQAQTAANMSTSRSPQAQTTNTPANTIAGSSSSSQQYAPPRPAASKPQQQLPSAQGQLPANPIQPCPQQQQSTPNSLSHTIPPGMCLPSGMCRERAWLVGMFSYECACLCNNIVYELLVIL